MAIRKNSNEKLSIVILINQLSLNQLKMLAKHFENLSQNINLTLINQITYFPVLFYQLRDVCLLEQNVKAEAQQELCQAAAVFNTPVRKQVFYSAKMTHIVAALIDVDHLIGHGLDNAWFLWKKSTFTFIGSVRRWLEEYGVEEGFAKFDQIDEHSNVADFCVGRRAVVKQEVVRSLPIIPVGTIRRLYG